jgi:hypothetical protein
MNDKQRKVILDWMRKMHKMEYAHRYQSMNWKRTNYCLGIPSLILATLIGALSTIPSIPENILSIIVPIAAITVAILSGLQTFLRPTEKESEFKNKSDEFEKLRHKTEEFLEFHKENQSESNLTEILKEIREEWGKIGNLNVNNSNFNKADKRVKSFHKYPEPLGFLDDIEQTQNKEPK